MQRSARKLAVWRSFSPVAIHDQLVYSAGHLQGYRIQRSKLSHTRFISLGADGQVCTREEPEHRPGSRSAPCHSDEVNANVQTVNTTATAMLLLRLTHMTLLEGNAA